MEKLEGNGFKVSFHIFQPFKNILQCRYVGINNYFFLPDYITCLSIKSDYQMFNKLLFKQG